jgi:hypothetical protein
MKLLVADNAIKGTKKNSLQERKQLFGRFRKIAKSDY